MEGLRILSRTGSPSDPIRVAVFFSGSGTGLNALLSHQANQGCNHKTVVCVTNKEKAGGIVFAENHRVPVIQEFLDLQYKFLTFGQYQKTKILHLHQLFMIKT